MKKNIIVSGSLAYDRINGFPGYFSEHILPKNTYAQRHFSVNSIKRNLAARRAILPTPLACWESTL